MTLRRLPWIPRPLRAAIAVVPTIGLLAACAGPGVRDKSRIEHHEDGGFTITEPSGIDARARDDFERALDRIEAGRLEEGIALLERVTEAAPRSTTAHVDLGIARRMNGDYEAAETALLAAVALYDRHPVAHNELGIVYRKMGRFEDARRHYERALDVSADFHYARRNLAILCDVYLEDLACALEHYEIYAKVAPEDEPVAMWITDVRNRLGRK